MLSGTDILRRQRRDCRQHRGRHNKQSADDLFHDSHRSCIVQSTVIGDHGNQQKGDLNAAILYRNRKADLQNLPHHHTIRAKIGVLQRQSRIFPENHGKRNHHANSLGQRSPQRRTGSAHFPCAQEQIIQPDICRTGDCDKVHGAFGISHATENGANNIIGCDKRDSQKSDDQILHRFCHSLFRRADQNDNRSRQA